MSGDAGNAGAAAAPASRVPPDWTPGRYLTDAQWETLLGVVTDDEDWTISHPMRTGGECRLIAPDGTRHYVKPDGRLITP